MATDTGQPRPGRATSGPSPGQSRRRGWLITRTTGPAAGFHDRDPVVGSDGATDHEIWVHRVPAPALVLGSTQHRERTPAVDPVEICRRRSGGGLVYVRPDDLWIDAVVPTSSPLHRDDIGAAFAWLGRTWRTALAEALGPEYDLRMVGDEAPRSPAGRPFHCFASRGHGEVLLGRRKLVGLAQRRTRHWSRLQALLITGWEPTAVNAAAAAAVGPLDSVPSILGDPPFDAALVEAGPPHGMTIDITEVERAVLANLPTVEVTFDES